MVHSEQPASRVAVANAPYVSDLTGLGQRLGAEGSCRGRLGEAAPGTATDPGEGRGGRARRRPRGWLRVLSPRGTTAARRNAEGQADGDARDPVGNAGSAAGGFAEAVHPSPGGRAGTWPELLQPGVRPLCLRVGVGTPAPPHGRLGWTRPARQEKALDARAGGKRPPTPCEPQTTDPEGTSSTTHAEGNGGRKRGRLTGAARLAGRRRRLGQTKRHGISSEHRALKACRGHGGACPPSRGLERVLRL